MKTRVTTIKKIVLVGFLFSVFVVTPIITSAAAVKSANKNGLVGYWAFNEGVGTKTGDASGKVINGTVANTTWSSGRFGKALYFNGTNSYVSTPYNSALDLTNNITMSVWYKKDVGSGTNKWLLHKATVNTSYAMFIEGGLKMRLEHPGMQDCTTTEPSEGVWHHAVSTYDGANMKVYVDGVLRNTCAATGNISLTGYGVEIGSFGSTGYPFKGLIDEVRIYNRALTASEVLDLYKAGDGGIIKTITSSRNGLVGYWPMNEYTGSGLNDMSGNKNNGLISSASWVAGKFGKALSFNGSSSYVDAGNKIDTSNITAMTISAWVYNNAAAANKGIAGWWNGTNGIFIQNETTATDGVVFIAGGGTSFGTVNYTTVNRWTHVTLVYDGSLTGDANRLKGYVDGVQRTLSFAGGVVPASFATSGNFIIGNVNTLTRYWNGKIDEVKVYNRALSASEVSDLYKSGGQTIINASKNDLLANGLVGLWSFDGKDMNWSANKVLDRSGRGNDGTLVGMSTTSSPVIGKIGQALKFSGNNYVSLSAVNPPSYVTVSGWFKRNGPSSNTHHILFMQDVQLEISIPESTGQLRAGVSTVTLGRKVLDSGSGLTDNNWHFLSFTYDGAMLRAYIDGVETGTLAVTGALSTGGSTNIGNYSTYYANASIDDVRVYNRALSSTEIKQLYNTGR
jgi:hypothetical protein